MKVIIDGSKISFAKIEVSLEGKCLYAGEISRNCFETDVSVLSNQEMLLHFTFFDGEGDDSEIEKMTAFVFYYGCAVILFYSVPAFFKKSLIAVKLSSLMQCSMRQASS